MVKTFVLDTNVLLHNPGALFVFEENQVVIPLAVIEEIDDQKRRQDEIGRNARAVSRALDDLRISGKLAEGVPLHTGGNLRIEINNREMEMLPDHLKFLDTSKPDNRILAVALNLSRNGGKGNVTLVSKDLNLRLKADLLGIKAEDLTNDKVDFNELYTGQSELSSPQAGLDDFYQYGSLPLPRTESAYPNQFVVLKSSDNPSSSALSRHRGGELNPLIFNNNSKCFGLKARNKEQLFALELLMDQKVKVVTLAGGAGTGKTLLALAAGLEQVLEQNLYTKLLVTRPVIPLEGQDLGFLPGDKEEKIRPWMQPIYDNLEFLFRFSSNDNARGQKNLFKGSERNLGIEDYLSYTGQLEMEALTYIRGRSIPKQFIIVDEAQNCSPHAIKTMLTRVGEGSKIVFTGDIDQIDHPYLDSASNGFTVMVEKIKDQAISGHVTLVKGERSEIAEMGAKVL
jgi:PhoH-like ATPase